MVALISTSVPFFGFGGIDILETLKSTSGSITMVLFSSLFARLFSFIWSVPISTLMV